MKKAGFILLAIAAIVIGLLIGTLNATPVYLDLLWIQLEMPLGLAILLGFSFGLLTGLSVLYLARVLPLRLQLRKARAAVARQDSNSQDAYLQDKPAIDAPDD